MVSRVRGYISKGGKEFRPSEHDENGSVGSEKITHVEKGTVNFVGHDNQFVLLSNFN